MCEFQKLSFSEHGYVVRCQECGHYQLAFGTTMLTLSNEDFKTLHGIVQQKYLSVCKNEACVHEYGAEAKSVVISTPFTGMCIVVTRKELNHLNSMMENADNEIQALIMMELFK